MTSDVKGYVVRVNFEGHEDWICRISGNLCPCVKEERTLFTLGDAIEASKMPRAPAVATIFRAHADGCEEKLPSLEEALDHLAAVYEALAITPGETATGAARRVAAELAQARAQVSALMDRVERESRVVFDAERARDEARAEIERLRGADPLAALEAAERRLLEAGGWTETPRGFWLDNRGDERMSAGVDWPKTTALCTERERVAAAKKGGAQ